MKARTPSRMLVAVLLACCATSSPAAAAGLEVVDVNGAALKTVAIKTTPGTGKGRAVFYVRQTKPASGKAKKLDGVVLVADFNPAVDVALAAPGAAADGSFSVPATGLTRVVASVADPPEGEKTGTVSWTAPGRGTLAKITVTRPVGDVLKVTPSSANGIEESTSVSSFDRVYEITSSADEKVQVRIDVGSFETDRGVRVEPAPKIGGEKVDPTKAYEVTAAKPLRLAITAELTATGKYRSRIRLIAGSSTTSVPITVMRDSATANFELTGDEIRQLTVPVDNLKTTATFNVIIRETDGRSAMTGKPELRLTRKNGTSAVSETTGAFTVAGKPPAPLTLAPREERSLDVKVSDLGPGEWTPKLVISGGEGAPKSASATVFVRQSWLLAAFWILAGVGLSFLLRKLWVDKRTKLVASQGLAAVEAALVRVAGRAGTGPDEVPSVDHLRERLRAANKSMDSGTAADDAAKEGTAVRDKLDILARWLTACKAAHAAGITKDEWPAGLEAVRAFLVTDGETDAKVALQKLSEAEQEVGHGALKPRIDELQRAYEEWRGLHDNEAPEAGVKSLDEAREKRTSDPAAARTAFRAAWRALVDAAAGELRGLVNAAKPPGVEDDKAWSELGRKVREAVAAVENSEPEEALARYKQGYELYLRVVAKGLRRSAFSKQSTESDEQKKALFGAIVSTLDRALGRLDDHDLRQAREHYVAAVKAFGELAEALKDDPVGGQMATERASIAAEGIDLAAIERGATLPAAEEPPPAPPALPLIPSPATLAASLKSLDFVVLAISAVAAVCTGVVLLYVDAPAWGGLKDSLIAVLWGLGLYQGTSTGFAGLYATADRISGVKPAQG